MLRDLIGRERELAVLAAAAEAAAAGRGSVVLIAGEAGAGKTALARAALAATDFRVLEAAALETPGRPYAPVAAVLRAHRRDEPRPLLPDRPRLRQHLACVLPELGPAPDPPDPGAVFEGVAAALLEFTAEQPVGVLLDDLHWSDETSLDVVRFLADCAERSRLLLIGTYRSDAIPRDHPVRRLRSELRRAGRLREVVARPLSDSETGVLLERVLGQAVAPGLSAAIHDRTEGVPFFVQEVAGALSDTSRLRGGPRGLELCEDVRLPLPESVRDAILMRANGLPAGVREVLGIAAVLGTEFELATIAELRQIDDGLAQLPDCGLVLEVGDGRFAFRHALVREALYADLPWSRRRMLHRAVARHLEERAAPPARVATHWLAVGERERARTALLAAASASWATSAYRDTASALSHALDLWPADVDAAGRLDALDLLGRSAELLGDGALAARAWAEVAEGLESGRPTARYAQAQRRLANALELQGGWERAFAAHQSAAAAFAASGEPGEAAAERLANALRLRTAGSFHAALDLLSVAGPEAERAARPDLVARIWAREGNTLCRMGDAARGLQRVRSALDLALSHHLAGAAAEAYVRLADSLEHTGDYRGARTAYLEASSYCRANDLAATDDLCLACLTMVLRQLGEWERATDMCRTVLASPTAAGHPLVVVHGILGSIYALRGRSSRARPHLHRASALAGRSELAAMEMDVSCMLARLDDLAGRPDAALDRCQAILRRWERTDCEQHYSVPVFRWMATFGSERGSAKVVQAATSALARIVARPGVEAFALAALAHSVGEAAMMEGDWATAVRQFDRALAAFDELDLPLDRAETERRAGLALVGAGRRSHGLERLVSAHRTARRLGARPLATAIASEVSALGERVDRRLGRVAAAGVGHGGLSRREVEIARHVVLGRTSREIASNLSLSPRTVEMHVHHILVKLDLRSRVDIARRAAELGLATAVDAQGWDRRRT